MNTTIKKSVKKTGIRYFMFIIFIVFSCGKQKDTVVTQQGYLSVADSRLYYETTGEGESIIFLHGGYMDRRMWLKQVEAFAGQYQVITVDMRGHGLTFDGDSSYYMYEAIRILLDFLQVRKATLVGLSLGAIVATDFALEYPEYTSKLVLVTPGIHSWKKEVPEDSLLRMNSAQMEKAIVELKDTAMAAEYFVRSWFDGPQREAHESDTIERKRALAIVYATMKNHRLQFWTRFSDIPATTRLRQIQLPVLIIEGEKDNHSIKLNCDTLMSSMAQAQRVLVRGVAHMPSMERPEEFNRILMEFLMK